MLVAQMKCNVKGNSGETQYLLECLIYHFQSTSFCGLSLGKQHYSKAGGGG